MFENITVIILVYNEQERIESTLKDILKYFINVIVIDDNSIDKTRLIAKNIGVKVIQNNFSKGYIGSTKTGFKVATSEWIATIDADGEHRIMDLVNLCKFAIQSDFDLVIGKRPLKQIYRPSEILLSSIAYIKSPVFDTGSGMKVIKKEIADKMELFGKCICGTFVLESLNLGAKIGKYPIYLNKISKPRGIAWYHWAQFFILIKYLLFKKA